jgi:hypothetical protein
MLQELHTSIKNGEPRSANTNISHSTNAGTMM